MGAEPLDLAGDTRAEADARGIPLRRRDDGGLIEPDRSDLAVNPVDPVDPADLAAPELSMRDRAIRAAYARGVSARNLVRPFGKPAPLRLLGTVAEPLPGERSRGMALRAGHFLIRGKRVVIDKADLSGERHARPIADSLHRFDWLADLEAAGTRDKVAPIGEDLMRRWLLVNHEIGEGEAWDLDRTGHRLLNWLIHAPLVLSSRDDAFRASALRHIAATADWLDRRLRRRAPPIAALPAWCALIAAGLLLPDGKPRRLFAEAGLAHALSEAVGGDGGLISRSPADQADAIVLMLRVAACYRASRRALPAPLDGVAAMLTPPLLAVAHSNGSTGSWQGAAPIGVRRLLMMIEAGNLPKLPLRDADDWGYRTLSLGHSVLQFDAAPPPMPREHAAGCASTLAFEFSHKDECIVVNCGGASLAGAAVPERIERGLRGTAAHSTLALSDADSTTINEDGTLGAGVRAVTFEREGASGQTTLVASHDGYAARTGLLHQRRLTLSHDGETLEAIDSLLPKGKRGKRGHHAFSIRFHLGEGIEIGHQMTIGDHGGGAALALADGSYWQFRSPDAPIAIEESLWVDETGIPRAVRQLVVTGSVPREGGVFGWSLRRMG